MRPALLIVNPRATRVTPAVAEAVARELRARGPLDVVETAAPGHATELAAAAGEREVFVLSGDGGFNEALNGAGLDTVLGLEPGGGTNVLSRALGLPRDPRPAARPRRFIPRADRGGLQTR